MPLITVLSTETSVMYNKDNNNNNNNNNDNNIIFNNKDND